MTIITTVAMALRSFYGPAEVVGRRILVAGPRDTIIEVRLLRRALQLVVRGHGVTAARHIPIGSTADAEALAAVVVWVVGELVEALGREAPTVH